MGFWLFSSNPCNCSSCELGTHPGAHRLVYVRRPNELNAFRKAVKTAPDSVRCRPPTHALAPDPVFAAPKRLTLHRNAFWRSWRRCKRMPSRGDRRPEAKRPRKASSLAKKDNACNHCCAG